MIESGTWSVLFTDIVGSTEVRSRLGDDAADVLFSRLDAAVSSAIDAHQGVLVKGLGDGHMAAFRRRGRRDRSRGRDPAGGVPRAADRAPRRHQRRGRAG